MSYGQLYKKFAVYYDKIYENVDYVAESEFIKWAVKKYKTSPGIELMDVACGTGSHAMILKNNFKVTGVDINENMLEIAHKKVPEADFIKRNMKKLELKSKFDVVICIFSAIHYNTNYNELEGTLTNFYNHLENGGILIYDLSLNYDNWIEGVVSVDTVVEEELKIARICQSTLKNGIFNANFVFLVKDNDKFDFDIDEHHLGVFEIDEVINLMNEIGFETYIYGDFTFEMWESGRCQNPSLWGLKRLKQIGENNMRIAVSVSDDEKFTEHFGRAQKFLIYEFDGEKTEFLDRRESKKILGEKHQWGKSLKIVDDCDVVICLQIGMTAKPGLKSAGKKVVEDEGPVEEVLNRFVEHEKFMNKPLNF